MWMCASGWPGSSLQPICPPLGPLGSSCLVLLQQTGLGDVSASLELTE